jgi:hypothetical protein
MLQSAGRQSCVKPWASKQAELKLTIAYYMSSSNIVCIDKK